MYIYNGNYIWNSSAEQNIVFVFPSGFSLNDPVCGYWQVGPESDQKTLSATGVVTAVDQSDTNKYKISFDFDDGIWDATFEDDFKILTTQVREEREKSTLSLKYQDTAAVPSTSVFLGKLDWSNYARNEMAILIIPNGVSNGAAVVLIYRWTRDRNGNKCVNRPVVDTFRDVVGSADTEIKGKFGGRYYTYEATVRRDKREAIIQMSNPTGYTSITDMKRFDHTSLGRRKALIFRFGTGIDSGIFLLRDMLTEHLGFSQADVEMCYFDVESDGNAGKLTKGQEPPTPTNFKKKFASFVRSASAGDIRFLYVDAHVTTRDDHGSGWVLAEDNAGKTQVVSDEWFAQAIHSNHRPGVNLTILTSSGLGKGMLGADGRTPGIVLAGCHETQFSVKALDNKDASGMLDPWLYAIISVIKSRVLRKRAVPTYASLFNEAKLIVRNQLQGYRLHWNYKGPSPDETNPNPRDQSWNTSYQDPQLIYCEGYFEPDTERFLFPLAVGSGGHGIGDVTRVLLDGL